VQEQFGLIEPTGMGRGWHHAHPTAIALEETVSEIAGMAGTPIPNQMEFACSFELAEEFLKNGTKLLTIVSLQAPAAHDSAMDDQSDREIDGAMAKIIKFLTFDLPRPHWLSVPLQGLEVGFFIPAENNLIALPQALNLLVTPENPACAQDKLGIQSRGLPVPKTMRLKGGLAQDQRHRRMGNVGRNPCGRSNVSQAARRPVSQAQAQTNRLATGQLLDPNSGQGGKTGEAAHSEEHPIPPPIRAPRSGGTHAKCLARIIQGISPSLGLPSGAGPWPAKCEPVAPHAAQFAHGEPTASTAVHLWAIIQSNEADVFSCAESCLNVPISKPKIAHKQKNRDYIKKLVEHCTSPYTNLVTNSKQYFRLMH